MHLLPESELIGMAKQQYAQFIRASDVEIGTENARMVERVGKKIASSVEFYMHKHGHSKRIKGFQWEFKLVNIEYYLLVLVYARRKICLYTGILNVAQNETGLAVVMGHEVAHAIARHGNERMSKAIAAQMGGVALSVAVSNKAEETQRLFNQAYGLGSGLGGLAFSRKNELESDKLGLVFMHLAGYDASKAVDFWKRMTAHGAQTPEFLSTHPSDERRVKEIEAFLKSQSFKHHTK